VRRTKKLIAAEVLEAASQGQFGELTNLSSTYSHVALFTNTSNTAAWQALVQQAQLQVSSADTAAAVSAADAAADAPGSQQQQQLQQQVGRSSRLSLCRSSGLGSFRQQVWIHSQSQGLGYADALGTQGTVFDAEAFGTPAQVTLLPSESQPAAAAAAGSEGDQQPTAAAAAKQNGAANGSKAVEGAAAAAGTQEQVTLPPALPLTPELQQQQLKVLPNLGYACLCMTMRKYEIFNSRDCVKKTRDAADGLQKVSELALQNAR
jgi:UV DNA damage endonuclease